MHVEHAPACFKAVVGFTGQVLLSLLKFVLKKTQILGQHSVATYEKSFPRGLKYKRLSQLHLLFTQFSVHLFANCGLY